MNRFHAGLYNFDPLFNCTIFASVRCCISHVQSDPVRCVIVVSVIRADNEDVPRPVAIAVKVEGSSRVGRAGRLGYGHVVDLANSHLDRRVI
jgi:hypothetical protein